MTQEEFNAMLAVGISQGLPGSYYTSRYKNGEEIDRRLGNAAVPAVGDNILINADFRHPVNRNGKTEYAAAGYTIDRWEMRGAAPTVIKNSKGITIASSAGYTEFYQRIEYAKIAGKQATISAITTTNEFIYGTVTIPAIIGIMDLTPIRFANSCYINLIVNSLSIQESKIECRVVCPPGTSIELLAAKLELGDAQTLARQNSDGKWELIDPPNYPLQYALCSQYSPTTGEWVGSQHSNPNLLDNWYFVDPINQRGAAEYAAQGYAIDRWMVDNNGGQGSLKILDGFIRGTKIALSSNGGTSHAIHTAIEMAPRLSGKTVTLSAMVRGTGGTAVLLDTNHGIVGSRTIDPSTNWTLCSVTVELPNDLTYLSCFLYFDLNSDTMGYTDFYAAKLELGAQQTLAHKEGDTWVLNDPPPNKALELAKCQRYQIWGTMTGLRYIATGNQQLLFVPIPTPMRTTPTLIGTPWVFSMEGNVQQGNVTCYIHSIQANGVVMIVDGATIPVYIYMPGGVGFDANL